MSLPITVRRWFVGAGLAVSVSVLATAPAMAAASSAAVAVSDRGAAVPLSGHVPADEGSGSDEGSPAGTSALESYPAEPDLNGPSGQTPDRRFVVDVDGVEYAVACLDLCDSPQPGDYDLDPDPVESPSVAAVLDAAARSESGLTADAEATAQQAAIWYAESGFVLDAGADPAIRARVAALVAAADAASSTGSVAASPTVLVGADAAAPVLVVTDGLPGLAAATGTGTSTVPAVRAFAEAAAATTATSTTTGSTSSTVTSSGVTSSSGTTASSTGSGTTSSSTTMTTSGPATTSSTDTGSTATAATTTMTSAGTTLYYVNCAAVWAAIGRPLLAGEPGYRPALDSDSDGIACEQNPNYTNSSASAAAAAGGTDPNDDALASTGFAVARPILAAGAMILIGSAMVVGTARRWRPPGVHRPDL